MSEWLQLKDSFLVFPRGQAVWLRHRSSTRVLAVESPGLDVSALVEQLSAGISAEALASSWEQPDQSAKVASIVRSLQAKGALLATPVSPALPEDELRWFSRALAYFAEHESPTCTRFDRLARLRGAHVLMLGVGSLGSATLLSLACAGVGKITVVDNDLVEASNLSRQVAYACSDIGRWKVDCAVDAVRRLTPFVEVVPVRAEVTSAEDVAVHLARGSAVDLVVLTADMPVWQISRWSAEACRRAGVPLVRGNSLGIGPFFLPDRPTACPGCDWPRLLASQPGVEAVVERYRDQFLNGRPSGIAAAIGTEISVGGALLAQEAIFFLAGLVEHCRSVDHRIEVDAALGTRARPFPRDERCEECGPAARARSGASSTELRYGRAASSADVEVVSPAGIAPFRKSHVAHRHPRLPLRDGERAMWGHGFGLDEPRVRRQAIAELVEHASAFYAGLDASRLVETTHEALSAGARVLPLAELLRYDTSAGTVAAAVDPLRADSRLSWVEATVYPTEARVHVPALLAFLCWQPPAGEPVFALPDASGLAAHPDRDAAVLHGFQEVVERDAAMLSWKVPGWPVRRLSCTSMPGRLRDALARLGLFVELFDIGRLDGPSVVLAVVSSASGKRSTCGTSCRAIEADAVTHAVEEAIMMRHALEQRGLASEAPSADGALPTTSIGHVAWHHQRGRGALDWYARQAERGQASGSAFRPADRAALLARTASGEVLVVDVTDARARDSGWTVVRVLVAGAQPRESNALAPCHGTLALARAMERSCGESLNDVPHPFG